MSQRTTKQEAEYQIDQGAITDSMREAMGILYYM